MSATRTASVGNRPTQLNDNTDVQDFDIGDGKFARVILELATEINGETQHLVIYGQAYEVDKHGNFKSAPLGYPSRTARTGRSIILSAVGDTCNIVDAWCRNPETYAPESNVYPVVQGVPHADGGVYGDKVWDEVGQCVRVWKQGEADLHAEQKAEELVQTLATSAIRSGLAFRR